jgi:hypothetical protein
LEGMVGYTQALKAYVILHTFDSTLKSSIPFIDIKRTSNSDLFVKKYEWKGFGAESYTS